MESFELLLQTIDNCHLLCGEFGIWKSSVEESEKMNQLKINSTNYFESAFFCNIRVQTDYRSGVFNLGDPGVYRRTIF